MVALVGNLYVFFSRYCCCHAAAASGVMSFDSLDDPLRDNIYRHRSLDGCVTGDSIEVSPNSTRTIPSDLDALDSTVCINGRSPHDRLYLCLLLPVTKLLARLCASLIVAEQMSATAGYQRGICSTDMLTEDVCEVCCAVCDARNAALDPSSSFDNSCPNHCQSTCTN